MSANDTPEYPVWTEQDQMLAELRNQIEALDSICETYSECFGGNPGGMGRVQAVEDAWNAATQALETLEGFRRDLEARAG